jgi:hypothetical protein
MRMNYVAWLPSETPNTVPEVWQREVQEPYKYFGQHFPIIGLVVLRLVNADFLEMFDMFLPFLVGLKCGSPRCRSD